MAPKKNNLTDVLSLLKALGHLVGRGFESHKPQAHSGFAGCLCFTSNYNNSTICPNSKVSRIRGGCLFIDAAKMLIIGG